MSSATHVGFFRGVAAYPSFSMDRYAECLRDALLSGGCDGLEIEDVLLPVRFPRGDGRLAHYWHRYPRYLAAARKTRFALNHVLDHSYGHLLYALDPNRTVATCHDIFPLKHWKGEIDGLGRRRVPPFTVLLSLRGLHRARQVITPSAATKRDLVRHLGLDEAAIHVIPYGLQQEFRRFTPDERETLLDDLPLGGPDARHLLAIDTGGPYKNQRATIEILARTIDSTGLDVRLVRAGAALGKDERITAAHLGVADKVIELGNVDRAAMPALYNRCDVLVFPSFYEGFGWPPLEAMGCGLPVVSSRWDSLVEVVGTALPSEDATDYDALASHVVHFLNDPGEAMAASRRALERAKTFTWHKAAVATAAVYRAVLE